MARFITILEDDTARSSSMFELLADRLPEYEPLVFRRAREMIKWLEANLDEVALISLDHDLGPSEESGGMMVDPGNGRDVVEALTDHLPACPVVIHSSNGPAVVGMQLALGEASWTHKRVVPIDGLTWIDAEWIETCQKVL